MVTQKTTQRHNGTGKQGSVLDLLTVRGVQENCLLVGQRPGRQKGPSGYVAVVKVDPVGFSIMSEQEQEATLEGYRVLLQRLSIGESLSIHVRVLPYDLLPYLTRLSETRRDMPASFQKMSQDHEEFVRHLASQYAISSRQRPNASNSPNYICTNVVLMYWKMSVAAGLVVRD
jgi:hypothetical protein